MGFLNIWLLAGIAGIGVPIIIHLLNRFRQREVDWGAMELLRRAMVVRSRQIQFEDLLLLAMRCLAIILIALAMARPTVSAGGAGWFGKGSNVGMLVAIDCSYSMDHRSVADSRLDKAIARVREVLQTADAGTPITLVQLGESPRVLLRNAPYEAGKTEEILKKIAPLPERLNLDFCLSNNSMRDLVSLAAELRAPQRECYIITDGQAATWGAISDNARKAFEKLGGDTHVSVLPVWSEGSENLAITNLEMASGACRVGGLARYVARVTNTGKAKRSDVMVKLYLDQEVVDRKALDPIDPGESRDVSLYARFETAGNIRVRAEIPADPLKLDNTRYAVARVREQVRVLLIDGSPDADDRPFRGETDFIARTLVPKNNAESSIKIEKVTAGQIPAERLGEYDVIFLANVADVTGDQAAALAGFVQQGGGLVISLGDKIDSTAAPEAKPFGGYIYNARLGNKVNLLPADLVGVEKFVAPPSDGSARKNEGWTLAPAAEHRLSRLLTAMPPELLDEARVSTMFRVTPREGAVELARASNGLPLLLERSLGRGKVLMLTTTVDRDWTNLPIHPLFPMLIHESINYLTSRWSDRAYLVDEPLVVPLPAGTIGASVAMVEPSGNRTSVTTVEKDGLRVAEYRQPTEPGFYAVQYGSEAPPVVVAVNPDSRESAAACLSAEGLKSALQGVPVKIVDESTDLAEAVRTSRVGWELWKYLMIAGLAMLMAEAALAWYFSKRLSTDQDVATSSSREELLTQQRDSEVA